MVPEVEQLASAVLVNPVQIRIVPCQTTTALIEQSVCFVSQSAKLELLAHYLSQAITTRTVVFTRTKHGADRVVRKLAERNISAMAIHGNKSQNARERALSAFKSDRVPVLVATDVAARGIDIDNISHVFNYDLPEDPKTYLHRIGRTGRAGANGIAISFCDPDERRYLRDIEKTIRQPLPPRNDVPTHLPTSATATSPGHTSPSNPPRRAESRRAESQRTSSRREATQPRETGKTSQVHAAHPRGEFRAVAPKFAATQGNEAKRKFRKKFKSRGTTKASGSSVPAPHARPAKSKKFRSSRPSSR
jgi:ATP-dependent RNA helicase RhlE